MIVLRVLRGIRQSVPATVLDSGVVLLTGASTACGRFLARFLLEEGFSVAGLTRSEAAAAKPQRSAPAI